MTPTVQRMTLADWPPVLAICREGIATGNSTFETEAPGWKEWDAALRPDCRLAARLGGFGPCSFGRTPSVDLRPQSRTTAAAP